MKTAMRIDFKHITTTMKGTCDSQKQKKRKQPVRWLVGEGIQLQKQCHGQKQKQKCAQMKQNEID
jgi:hypothetical protein